MFITQPKPAKRDGLSVASHAVAQRLSPVNKNKRWKVKQRDSLVDVGALFENDPRYDNASTAFAMPTDTHILDGFIDSQDGVLMRQCQRDMYYHDPICGGCVDIYSSLPFGEFSLTGVPEKEMINTFLRCAEALRLKTLFPLGTIDQMVDGAMTGAMSFNAKEKIFDKYLPLNLDYVDVYINPFHGEDALLDIKMDQDTPNYVFKKKDDKRVDKIMKEMPATLKEFFTGGQMLKLDPENTVFIPRVPYMSHAKMGSSLFRRVMPIWLMEKALMRGTIEQAHRRQRGIMWIQMGGPDYVASIAEMQQMGSDVVLADRDPLGAVLVTRPDVNFQEIREGGNLWKHSDVVDTYVPMKLRAMGFPQALIDGDLSVGGADTLLTVFNRQLRSHRDGQVRSLCYEKIFPIVSIANDYEKEDKFIETSSDMSEDARNNADYAMMRELANPNGQRVFGRNGRFIAVADGKSALQAIQGKDPSKYYIPTLNWHDSLRPEVQADYLDVLDKLQMHNVPVPIRTYIAAAGITVGDLVASMDEDFDLRKVMFNQMKKLKKFMPANPDQQGMNMAKQLVEAASEVMSSASADRRGLLNRTDDFAQANDEYLFNVNDGLLSRQGKALLEEKFNKVIAESGAKLGQRENYEARKRGFKRTVRKVPK
jgi:hypothetical protein